MMGAKKTYFASDFHLGIDARLTSAEREKQVARWLHTAAQDAEAIYLVGDMFEAWFEYRATVPKGFTRFFGALAELRDDGLPIYAFTGNHDLWMFGYFEEELGIPVYKQPIIREIGGRNMMIGHGDGLGPGDTGYKLMKKVFTHPISQRLYRWLHPDIGFGLMRYFSQKSRAATPDEERDWLGEDREWLLQYCLRKTTQLPDIDYFIFGHRHLPIDWRLAENGARYINLGEWMHACSYAVFDGADMQVRFFENEGRVRVNPHGGV